MTAIESRPGCDPRRLEVVARDKTSVPDVADILHETHRNGDDWWKSCALAAVEHLAALGAPFTAYDLAALGVPEPDVPARWGGLFAAARAAGLIAAVGIVGSPRPSVHRALVRLWIGAEHVGDGDGR